MTPATLLQWLEARVARDADLCLDSRRLRPGDVFFARPGRTRDGRDCLPAAVAAGAAAIVCAAGRTDLPAVAVPVLQVPGLDGLLGPLAHAWYGRPSERLTVIAITGTNGKTSVVQWLAEALNAGGVPCASMGTLGTHLPDGTPLNGAALTTPDVLQAHRDLAAIVRAGGQAVALEASSIGLDQGRLDGVQIDVAGFTNLTRDHLDYHGDLAHYKAAKRQLFVRDGLRHAVLNADDPTGAEWLADPAIRAKRQSYGLGASDHLSVGAHDVRHEGTEVAFDLAIGAQRAPVRTALPGEHNLYNLLLVAGVLAALGWPAARVAPALGALRPVPGRLQSVQAPGAPADAPGPRVVVDYAHTPDALARALQALRPWAQAHGGRLHCVFGCGGDRDHGKRPLMGQVAAREADTVLVTTDNPRGEDPQAIARDILAGLPPDAPVQLDRARAILQAVWDAAPNDVVLLAGKGHETEQLVHGVAHPFDDREWARLALAWRQDQRLSTDTRTLQPGDLFVALRGPHFDGHDHLAVAAQRGARAALVARRDAAVGLAQIAVGDPRAALQTLATAWRAQFAVPLIAVTGSNGKTTTKEMIRCVLEEALGAPAVLASAGNHNNDLGVSLSALRLRPAHRAAVLELGMNHPGEIAGLAAIAQPTVALVNNAQREHQEFMDGVLAVARENGSVFEALPASGVAVFPAADAHEALWRTLAGARRVVRFGTDPSAEVRAEGVEDTPSGTRFVLCAAAQRVPVRLSVPGRHNVHNALAAAACALALGVSPQAVAAGLARFRAVGGRLHAERLADGHQLIDDSYNANPDSVRAAIDVLSALDGARVLVLGDMAEVGAQGPAMHAEVGAYACARGIEHLLTLGAQARAAAHAFGAGAQAFDELAALVRAIQGVRPAHILVKGSRSMAMERVVRALRDAPQGDAHVA